MTTLVPELMRLAFEMKLVAGPDQPLDSYTQSEEEVLALLEDIKANPDDYPSGRGIKLNGEKLSVVLTKDDEHGYDWHLSLVGISEQDQFQLPSKFAQEIVLANFFAKSKPVENHGAMKDVLHFVGSDK